MMYSFFLRDFDNHGRVLRYDAASGAHNIALRDEAIRDGLKQARGAFTEVGSDVFGVFASAAGPVFFRNDVRLPMQFGKTSARVETDPKSGIKRFELLEGGQHVLGVFYREKDGLGTNPYDQGPEDIDLFAMIAGGLAKGQFFANYTTSAA